MPALFVFLLKVNVALLVFCAGYYLVLRRLTFYTLNRIYLVTAVLFASVYPQINLSGFFQRHRQIAEPVQAVMINFRVPATAFARQVTRPDYWHWAEIIFWIGVALFALRLLIQLISLLKIYRSSSAGVVYGHHVRLIEGDAGPFSFWKSIYVNPGRHEPADLHSILLHEQIHIKQWHTLDILLAEISTIFYWFNPGIWLIKKAIRENIEFVTDRKILSAGTDTKQYQYSLVNVSFAAAPTGLVNNFNISTIKKRIIMMNAKRSSNAKLLRYAFLVPAVTALLLVFSISRAAMIKKEVYHSLISVKVKATAATTAKQLITVSRPETITVKINKKQKPDTLMGAINAKVKLTDTIKVIKTKPSIKINYIDSTKKDTIRIQGALHYDKPVMYIVDGEIVKDYDISKVEIGEIATINVAKTPKNGKTVVYIRTKNGVNVKPITSVRINGELATMPRVKIIGDGIATIDTIRTSKSINGRIVLDTTYVTGMKINTFKPLKSVGATINVFDSHEQGSVSLDRLSDKLVIIDGKTATEADLKKISVFDIDHVVVQTDKKIKEKYGDKAKNGVVFIVTKKK